MRRNIIAVCLAAVAVTVGVTACGGGSVTTNTNFVAGDGAVRQIPADKRGEPVALSGPTLTGGTLDIVTMRGKPVVLNVWGSWCGPCRKEAPDLQQTSVRLHPAGVPVVGINYRESDPANAQAFIRANGITYPSLVDSGSTLLAFDGKVSPQAIPSTVVLDAQGRIAAVVSGPISEQSLIDLVVAVAPEVKPSVAPRTDASGAPSGVDTPSGTSS